MGTPVEVVSLVVAVMVVVTSATAVIALAIRRRKGAALRTKEARETADGIGDDRRGQVQGEARTERNSISHGGSTTHRSSPTVEKRSGPGTTGTTEPSRREVEGGRRPVAPADTEEGSPDPEAETEPARANESKRSGGRSPSREVGKQKTRRRNSRPRRDPDEDLKRADRATESTRANYERLRRLGPVPLRDLEVAVVEDLKDVPSQDPSRWFGYRDFTEFAVQALPNIEFEVGDDSRLAPRRDSTEDDMLPVIRWLWLHTERRFPRLRHDQWRALLTALGQVNQASRWLGSPREAEKETLIAKSASNAKREFAVDLRRQSFEYVVNLLDHSGELRSGLPVHEFAGRFIDKARWMARDCGLPDLEFERMEAWIWGYERAADETIGDLD